VSDAPIGVFDSGLGGLTVVRALVERLPQESITYFGDTARVPYGPKSPDTVRRYSREIAAFLAGEGVKALVVACNTATAHALPALEAECAMPVVGVVAPGARAAIDASRGGPVGVIGTAGTIASGAYERALRLWRADLEIVSVACPLFVPLVEEGWLDGEATRLIARHYLQPLRDAAVDTLVLGCTHYPLLAPLLASEMPGARLIDSAHETAVDTAAVLQRTGLARGPAPGVSPSYRFIASDAPDHFLRAGRRFLGERAVLDRVETVTLG